MSICLTIVHHLALLFRERSDEDLEEYYRRKYVETSRKYVDKLVCDLIIFCQAEDNFT